MVGHRLNYPGALCLNVGSRTRRSLIPAEVAEIAPGDNMLPMAAAFIVAAAVMGQSSNFPDCVSKTLTDCLMAVVDRKAVQINRITAVIHLKQTVTILPWYAMQLPGTIWAR